MSVSNEYIRTLGLQKRKPDLGFLTESGEEETAIEDAGQLADILDTQFNIKVTQAECVQLFSRLP
jgi:hypothetical protein